MGKFRYINLILILSLTSGLVVGFPGRSEVNQQENNNTTESKEICTFNITLEETELKKLLTDLQNACKNYITSQNILFKKIETTIKEKAIPTRENLELEITNIDKSFDEIIQKNSALKEEIKKREEKELEFYYSLVEQTTVEIYQITKELNEKFSKDQLTNQYLSKITQEEKIEEFKININKEDLKISNQIQAIQDNLSEFRNIRKQEQRQKLIDLLLQSSTLVITNAVVTLILLKIIFNTDNKSNQSRSVSADIRTIKNQIYHQLSQEFTGNDQFARKINQLIQSFNNLETRITTLEQTTNYYPQTSSSSTTNRNYPSTPPTSLTKQITSLRSGNINFDEPAQPGIVEIYNVNPASLKPTAISVLVTEDSINETRSGRQQKIILQRTRRGNYWIVNDSGTNYLVPEDKFKINTFNFNTTIALFACNNYEASSSRNFRLIKPARVSVVTADQVWQLEERGVLQFE